MYYIDTPTRRVDAFDYEIATGAISRRRTVFQLGELPGGPDGMTIDTEGRLWIATWGGWSVLCVDPMTGELLCKVQVPASNVTSVCFGGPKLQHLYITTAGRGNDPAQPHAGDVFVAEVKATGLPTTLFNG
jgi:sugar lactone lactonase YvrE